MYKVAGKYINVLFFSVLLVTTIGFKKQPLLYQTTSGHIAFSSDAPLETIKALSNDLIGLIDISKKNFSFKIDVHSFKGFNSPLQKEHFNAVSYTHLTL